MPFIASPLLPPLNLEDNSEALAEYRANLVEDNARSGFWNLGSSTLSVYLDTTEAQLINGQGGNDTITLEFWSFNDDVVYGGSGHDRIAAGYGRDTLHGGSGNDELLGERENDRLYGGSGHDTLNGGDNDDLLEGGSGRDVLRGGAGKDTLYGGSGDDVLWGDAPGQPSDLYEGNDILFGGSGNDTLMQSGGFDTMWGGLGEDTFTFETPPESELIVGAGARSDYIADFNRVEGDMIDLAAIDANHWLAGDQAFKWTRDDIAGGIFVGPTQSNGDQNVFFNLSSAPGYEVVLTVHVGVGNALVQSDFFL